MISIAHLQPIIPHYREEFFNLVGKVTEQDVFIYDDVKKAKNDSFSLSRSDCKRISSFTLPGGMMVNNPMPLLSKKYKVLVLMLHFGHLTTWLLLLTKWLHRKKIILWGQGISVKRYLKEEKKPDWKLKLMISLADGVWFYMDKEKEQWQKLFPKKPMVALRNTLSGVNSMTQFVPEQSISKLKEKYGIKEDIILIFCARFTANRRIDLLMETIKQLDPHKFGFIIIGDGAYKPDFNEYHNVHDFGQLYDTSVKRELFSMADIYFQPGWVGLSIVEAMAYGKPIFTFKRTPEILQCVEYSYIQDGVNGRIFSNMEECISAIVGINKEQCSVLGNNAKDFAKKYLRVDQMVAKGLQVLEALEE